MTESSIRPERHGAEASRRRAAEMFSTCRNAILKGANGSPALLPRSASRAGPRSTRVHHASLVGIESKGGHGGRPPNDA